MPGFIRRAFDSAYRVQADDDNFWRNMGYILELVPPFGAPSVLMPLLLGPTEYSFDRQFAQSVEIAQNGGVHVNEYGNVLGRISIHVDPGVRPRVANVRVAGAAAQVNALSGLRRFLDVKEGIFKAYSDLKQDPWSSEETKLILHVLKDNDSYYVVPDRFSLRRQSSAAASYPYSIELIAIGRYDGTKPTILSPDQSIFDKIAAPARAVRGVIADIRATVDDVTYYMDQARYAALAWTNAINDVNSLIDAADDFLKGASSFIRIPHVALTGLQDTVERMVTTAEDWQDLSYSARTWWRDLEIQIERLSLFPDRFSEALNTRVEDRRNRQLGAAGYSTRSLALASGSLTGTGARSSDTLRASAVDASQGSSGYNGFQEIVVGAQDTPDGLAARFGIPWADIAAANNLRSPYFCEADLPCTVAPGDRIVIPIHTTGNQSMPTPTWGQPAGSSQQEDLFGVDARLDDVEGVAIDTAHGATDCAMVGGVDNVVQAIGMRLQTEEGSNPLYPLFGRRAIVGTVNSIENRLLAQVSTKATLLQDTRIKQVAAVTLDASADSIVMTLDVVLSDSSTVRAQGVL